MESHAAVPMRVKFRYDTLYSPHDVGWESQDLARFAKALVNLMIFIETV